MAAFGASGISVAALAFRGLLASELKLDPGNISIGSPIAVFPQDTPVADKDLNLFFFHVEAAGYPAADSPDEPQFVRIYCLVTSLAKNLTTGSDQYSAGEGDLRLIGNVVRLLHKNPAIRVPDKDPVAELQIVLSSMSAEDMGHVWSSQRETSYRLSVVYELALVPVPMDVRPPEGGPRVLETGVAVVSENRPPLVGNWLPEMSFVDEKGALVSTLVSETGVPSSVKVVGAPLPSWNGSASDDPGALELSWEAWDKTGGWRQVASGENFDLQRPPLATATAKSVNVPPTAAEDRQLLLNGVREWRYTGDDGKVLTERIRSNSLLISWKPGGGS